MRLALALACLLWAAVANAQTVRFATFNVSLNRAGPGLLLRDIEQGKDAQIDAVIQIIAEIAPDVLLLNEFDHDLDGVALDAFRAQLRAAGQDYTYAFAGPSNTGEPSGLDLNGNGKLNEPADAFGYGTFPGQYAMALLSKYPIIEAETRSFRSFLWADLPGALLPTHPDGRAFPSVAAQAEMRLSSKSHWDVPVQIGDAVIHVLAAHPTPPVFDGPEDFNGRRNHDEIVFWKAYLDGFSPEDDQGRIAAFAGDHAVIMGDLNADPADGDGRHEGIKALLTHPDLTDPQPKSPGAVAVADTGRNRSHKGDPSLDTADWNDTRGPGNLRVDYVLPTKGLMVNAAGVFWPRPDDPLAGLVASGKAGSSDHRIVWVDVTNSSF